MSSIRIRTELSDTFDLSAANAICRIFKIYRCDRIWENDLITCSVKIDFFPEIPSTEFKYCLCKI